MELDWNIVLMIGEMAVLLLFGYLVFKWNSEAAYTFQERQEPPQPELGEAVLLDEIEKIVGQVERTQYGLIKRASLFAIQRAIIKFHQSAILQVQAQERAQRRELFKLKKWRDYRRLVLQSQQNREERQFKLTEQVLKRLDIEPALYYQSITTSPYAELQRVHEEAMLSATIEWMSKCGDSVKLPVTRQKVMMAETSFQVRIAALHNETTVTDQKEVLVERFKIEDEIFLQTGVEVEHFILLRHEEQQAATPEDDETQVTEAFKKFENQPGDLGSWPDQKRQAWFETQFKSLQPLQLRPDGLLHFSDLMSIHKIMQPRIDPAWLDRRRSLFKQQEWKGYEALMRDQLAQSIKVAEQGYQSLKKVLGVDVSQVRQSVQTYCLDLDKRDLFERFMAQEVAPASTGRKIRTLTKQEALMAIGQLQGAHVTSYKQAFDSMGGPSKVDLNDTQQEEELQVRVQVELAKVRDRLYIDNDISENDIDQAIKVHNLENDKEFVDLMHKTQSDLRALQASFKTA